MATGTITTLHFTDDFIAALADRLGGEAAARGGDLSRLAVVFGGRRPAMFLARELGRRIGGSFFPPRFFTMDGFMEHALRALSPRRTMPLLDAWHSIYLVARERAPGMLKGRETFSRFAAWARETAAFIDELDIEDVAPEALVTMQHCAEIGLDAAPGVEILLGNITAIRDGYHRALEERGATARGLTYLLVSRGIGGLDFAEFEKILFCGFFSLHRTEERVVKELYDRGRADLYFQRGGEEWPALERLSKTLGRPISPPSRRGRREPDITLWAGFDAQTQVGLVRKIVGEIPDRTRTVIVLPDSGSVIPLVSEIASLDPEFNVSMGYPLKRSALCHLLGCVFDSQKGMRDDAYYARDYLRVLTHPLVKNMAIARDGTLTRVMVHKIEEALRGGGNSPLEGSLFVRTGEVEAMGTIPRLAASTLREMGIESRPEELEAILAELHGCAFRAWERIGSFGEFAAALESFVDVLVRKSALDRYPLNLTFAGRLLEMAADLRGSEAGRERFEKDEIFKLFTRMLERETINFSGSPLRGLQVLGLMETRSLDFKNVIVMDVNESVLPALAGPDPLVPRQVRVSLGLDRVEQEEEIQRYHFMRLVSHAEKVHLVYNDREEKEERSRFIEELVWNAQRARGTLDAAPVRRARVAVRLSLAESPIEKTAEVLRFLGGFRHSPSSVDTYLQCPLKFYYGYVLRLKETEDLLEEPAGADIGTFVHRLLCEAFMPFIGERPPIDRRFREGFFRKMEAMFAETFEKRMRADAFILEEVLRVRLGRFLDKEAERHFVGILALEEKFHGVLALPAGEFSFGCRVDRIDRKHGDEILVIDYKTGAAALPAGPDTLARMELTRESILRAVRSFQLPLYCRFAAERHPGVAVGAALYDLRDSSMHEFPQDRERFDETMARCGEALDFILGEIADPGKPFAPAEGRACAWCPFTSLCR
jgi:RecB family exonuclease